VTNLKVKCSICGKEIEDKDAWHPAKIISFLREDGVACSFEHAKAWLELS
jgi:lambda repressor-like predicted transcriptional regulator